MTEFTDEEGNVFVKLYKKENDVFHYWETWNTKGNSAIIHWGKLGETGKDIEISEPTLAEFKNEINSQINQKIKEGFNQIPIEKQYTVAITFQLDNWGNTKDLDRREVLRGIITENLGWTGNGRCDDGEIGSGEMTLFADVVDPYIAIESITKEFKLKGVPEKPRFTIIYEGEVIERDYKLK